MSPGWTLTKTNSALEVTATAMRTTARSIVATKEGFARRNRKCFAVIFEMGLRKNQFLKLQTNVKLCTEVHTYCRVVNSEGG